MLELEYEAAGCRVDYQPADDLKPVEVDALQIQLVLLNLLSNAVQSIAHSGIAAGEITVTAFMKDDLVQVSIADNGPGVPPGCVAQIFEPLYSQKAGGMGMGLSVCHDIIELHGGRLWYESNPAGGAIFRFTLRTCGYE